MSSAKWIEFTLIGSSPSGKTQVWVVKNKKDGSSLGVVSWFGRWRKYAFYPNDETVFEEDCLEDIAAFCRDQTRQHRTRLAEEKKETNGE